MPKLPSVTAEMQRRFGERFAGLSLTHIDYLYWPVWVYELSYTTYETVRLDALEEGLLLLITAGVRSIDRAALLLGCSKRYALEMARRLSAGGSRGNYLMLNQDGEIAPTEMTSRALETLERQVPVPQTMSFLRDGLFGQSLSIGTPPFERAVGPDREKGAHRWLRQVASSDVNSDSVLESALATIAAKEIVSIHLSPDPKIEWVTIWMAVYQPDKGSGGRYLLFNPACEDEPLLALSEEFEKTLLKKAPELYFPADLTGTAEVVWQQLAGRVRAQECVENERLYSQIREKLAPLAEYQTRRQDASKGQDQFVSEIASLRSRVHLLERELGFQQIEVGEIPRVDHIEADKHPAVVRSAISAATSDLVMMCPWITWRALEPLLPALDSALRRGCRVWIGYGMPKSPRHSDHTDGRAIAELKKRAALGMLRLAYLGTHEKVLIQDDRIFLNTSFNFLSYTGGDGRRESGTVQYGGIQHLRDKFIDAIEDAPAEPANRPAARQVRAGAFA